MIYPIVAYGNPVLKKEAEELPEGSDLTQLIQDMYAKVGSFAVERYDLHLTNELKESIIENCKSRSYTKFGSYDVVDVEDVDGYKFRLSNGSWVMIRPSGTEPVLRVYSESTDSASSFAILDATKSTILSWLNHE